MDTVDSALTTTDLLTLVETGRELAAEISLRALLHNILSKATQLTSSSASSIILFDERRQVLYFAAATGPKAAMVLKRWGKLSEKGIPLTGSKAGEVFATGQSMIIDAVEADVNHFKDVDRETKTPTESMVCVPLTVTGKRTGVMQILNKRTGNYTQRDRVLLEHFTAQAAVAIRNAQLFDDILAHMGLYASRDDGEGPLDLLNQLNRPASSEVLSVLFVDMRGFTQLCQVIGRPERVQELLNEFLAMLANSVVAHHGIVNKFLGDGLLALFRDDKHAMNAVQCAGTMVKSFLQLRSRWDDQTNVPLGFLDIGIGIATDAVILGSIGSERVRDFTAIGTTVNLAAHLMEHARDSRRILVDKITYRATRDIIEEAEGPEFFELKKTGQTVGHPYERYYIKTLKALSHASFSSSHALYQANSVAGASRKDVFVSYSHRDKIWLRKLQVHLKPFMRAGQMKVWDDTKIQPGKRWRDEIEHALATARVAILLVSANFLDSDFITSSELPLLLAMAEKDGLQIFWIPVSASAYEETDLSKYQAAFDPKSPLDTLRGAEQNRAWVTVCRNMKAALES